MNNYTQSREKKISNIVVETEHLSFEEVFTFAEDVIKMNNQVTPYKQIQRYIMNESQCATNYNYAEFKEKIENLCEKNILRWIRMDEQEKVIDKKSNKELQYEDLRLFSNGTRGSLPQIIADLCKYDKVFYDDEARKNYEERYTEFINELAEYKLQDANWKANGKVGEKPKRPTAPELRKINRYQMLFLCFVFECNVEQAEDLLYKVCNQRGFNFKNPLDLLCYCGLKHKTNKYGAFIKIRNAFYKAKIRDKSVAMQDTMHIRRMAEEKIKTIDFENANVEEIVDFIINTMVLSNELYDKVDCGQDIINYYFGYKDENNKNHNGHSKNPDCLTYSSCSARKELFYLLGLYDLLEERACLSEQIDECYNRLKNNRKQMKKDYLNMDRRRKLEKECEQYYEKIKTLFDIDENLTEANVLQEISNSFDNNDFNLDEFVEKIEMLAETVYYLPSYKLNAKGMFNETVLNTNVIEELVSGERSVSKEILILAYLYYFCQTETFLDREKTDNEIIEIFKNGINDSLSRAGFGNFYIVNPYDAVILLTLFTSDPIETLAEIIYMENVKNNTYGDE